MPSSAKRRAQQRARARTALSPKRRATNSQVLARRGMIALGLIVAVALIASLLGTVGSNGSGGTQPTTASQTDPNVLIRNATANPNDSDAVGALADYFDKTGQTQLALINYQHYIALRPDDARAHVSLGELLLGSGDLAGAQNQFAQALTFAAAVTDQRTAARAHLDLGDVYAQSQPPRPSDAIAEYQQAANLDTTGDIASVAQQRIAGLQPQGSVPAVTVVVPTLPATPRPTGNP